MSTPSRCDAGKHGCEVHLFSKVFLMELVGPLLFMKDLKLRPPVSTRGSGTKG